jgi:hypothetical protein
MRKVKEYIPNTFFGNIKFLKEIDSIRDKRGRFRRMGRFQCFCGNIFIKGIREIISFNTTSCGCKENRNFNPELRGCSYTPEYKVWNNFKNRCTNPKANNYHRYGGRGIKVCDEWQKFEGFIKDMGKRPTKYHTIERVDNDGDYCKDNCKWVTRGEQARNRSTNVFVVFDGRRRVIKDVAKEVGLTHQLILRRMSKGMTLQEAINKQYKYNKQNVLL